MNYTRNTSYVLILNSSTDSYNIVANSQYINPVYNVYVTNNTYKNNQTITSVNLHNIPFVNNSMDSSFRECNNLQTVRNINNNVTNMHGTFYGCASLVNAPVIPNSVIDMSYSYANCTSLVNAPDIPDSAINVAYTFYNCTSLVNAPDIPDSATNVGYVFYGCNSLVNAPKMSNSVTNMSYSFGYCNSLVNAPSIPNSVNSLYHTFSGCSSLVNAPEIPNSVNGMLGTFFGCTSLVTAPIIPSSITVLGYDPQLILSFAHGCFVNCTSLTGNIYIYSENILHAGDCFNGTSLTKNVYIPFTYENGVNTKTYNAFINAGYTTTSFKNGVYLKDINKNTVNIYFNLTTASGVQNTVYVDLDVYDAPNGNYINSIGYNFPLTAPRTVFTIQKEVDNYYYGLIIGGDATGYSVGPYNPLYINGVAYNTYTESTGPTTYCSPTYGQTAFQITGDTTISDRVIPPVVNHTGGSND